MPTTSTTLPATETPARRKLRAKRALLAAGYLNACKIENVEERKAALRALGFDPL